MILCPEKGSHIQIRVKSKAIKYIVCKPKHMNQRGKGSVPELLVPLTRKEDLLSNDFEGLNSLVQKVADFNLINNTRSFNSFG